MLHNQSLTEQDLTLLFTSVRSLINSAKFFLKDKQQQTLNQIDASDHNPNDSYLTKHKRAYLTYVYAYKVSLSAVTGSANAENPFDGAATSINAYGLETSYRISPSF